MHRLILMAGTIIASSVGFALAGFILGDAIRNSRRRSHPKRVYQPRFIIDHRLQNSLLDDAVCRGYDTPELHRADTLARTKSGDDQDYQ